MCDKCDKRTEKFKSILKEMNNNTAMTNRTQRKIENYSDVIITRFSDGDATQALQVYNKIASECMKCHVSLRKW